MYGNSQGSGRRFHLRKRGFNRASDLQRVRAILTGDDEDHAGSSLNGRGPNHRFGTIRNGGDISQSHAAAVLVPQDNVAELVWRKTLSFGSKDHALVRSIYESGSADTGRSPGGIEHFINRRAELDQAVRADLDLKLANLSTEDDDLGDTRYGEQTRAKRPICKSPDFHQRTLVGCETDLKHIARRRRERCHRWRPGTLRNARSDFHEPLADHLAGLKYVRAFRKDGGDDRKSLDRLRADRFQMRNAVHHGLNRPGHQLFHLFRR